MPAFVRERIWSQLSNFEFFFLTEVTKVDYVI